MLRCWCCTHDDHEPRADFVDAQRFEHESECREVPQPPEHGRDLPQVDEEAALVSAVSICANCGDLPRVGHEEEVTQRAEKNSHSAVSKHTSKDKVLHSSAQAAR